MSAELITLPTPEYDRLDKIEAVVAHLWDHIGGAQSVGAQAATEEASKGTNVPHWLFDCRGVGPFELAIYAGLGRFADEHLRCEVSHRDLAHFVDVSMSTTRRAVRCLESIGAVTVTRRHGQGVSNIYTLQTNPPESITERARKPRPLTAKQSTRKTRNRLIERDGGSCRKCGIPGEDLPEGEVLHVDHIIPIARGGSDELANKQLLCPPCNMEKGIR